MVYPKSEMARMAMLIKEAEAEKEAGETKTYSDIDKMFEDIGIDLDEVQD